MWVVAVVALLFGWLSEGLFAGFAAAALVVAIAAWREVGALRRELAPRAAPPNPDARNPVWSPGAPSLVQAARPEIAREPHAAVVEEPVPSVQAETGLPTADVLPSAVATAPETEQRPGSEAPPAFASGLTHEAAPAAFAREVVPAAKESRPPAPAAPPPPPIEQRLKQWLLGDNPVARAGVLVLLVGVALVLRLAVEHRLFPIEARLGCVALAGTWLTTFGFRQRTTRPTFSRLLQGAGIATLYMVVFFAYRSFQLLPSTLTFVLLVIIVMASGVLAVLQDALALVFVGTVGGFAAPILASSGGGNHVALFSYYLVLDVLVLGIAWFKDWRLLTLTGFVATFGVATTWGALRYEPALFASTEPFLLAFYAVYLAIHVMTALRRPESLRGGPSSSLTFGLPLVTLGLQTSLAGERDAIVAVTALCMSALYFALARVLVRHPEAPRLRVVVDGYLALSLGLATLSVPYALDSRAMVSATWLLEAAGLYWVGVRSLRPLLRLASVALLFVGVIAALFDGVWKPLSADSLPVLNASSLCALLLNVAVLFMSALAVRHRASLRRTEPQLVQSLLAWAVLVLALAIANEVEAHVWYENQRAAFVALVALFAALCAWLGHRLPVPFARSLALGSLLVSSGALAADRLIAGHDLLCPYGCTWAQPLVILGNGLVLHAQGTRREWPVRAAHVLFPLWLSALALCGAWDVVARLFELGSGWSDAVVGLGLALVVLSLERLRRLPREPFQTFAPELRVAAHTLVVVALGDWMFEITRNGDPSPLPFVPLLNPLELVQLGLFVLFVRASQNRLAVAPEAARRELAGVRVAALVALAFLGFNTLLARAVHHFGRVPYELDPLLQSDSFQVGMSLLWSTLGLAGTVWASRKARREAWLAAGSLLALVVAKLFLVDLARVGQGARILSFLAVGLLLLAVGYLAPLPPARQIAGEGKVDP